MFLFLQSVSPEVQEEAADAIAKIEDKITGFKGMSFQEILSTVTGDLISFGWKVLLALAIYFIGRWAIKYIIKFINRVFEKRNIDKSIRTFVVSLLRTVMYFILFITIISELGIEATSFVALFGAAGLAVGMALSGTLQNFAGGVMILLQRPFRVGDTIEAQGQSGTVKAINLFNTVINTPDNKTIYLPNGSLSTGILNNYSGEATRRIEWVFGIGYGDDYDKARSVIAKILDSDERILKDPSYIIAINNLGASSVDIIVRAWVNRADVFNVQTSVNEQVYKQFPANGLNIPYPQMDVHIINPKE